MKKLVFLALFFTYSFLGQSQIRENRIEKETISEIDLSLNSLSKRENDERGFTFGIDLGVYLASKKTANTYNGAGGNEINNQAIWYDVESRLSSVGINAVSNTIQNLNNEFPEYGGTITGFEIGILDLPQNMRYSPRLYFGLNATYHLSDYWAIVAKTSLANLKSTDVYTMELIGPSIPQNASEVIGIFDITGEEQRLHLDFGFKNISYNDYGFKWFWGAGLSMIGSKIDKNTAWIGQTRYELLISSSSVVGQNPIAYEAFQTAYNLGFYGTTGWEMEYDDRYEFGFGFVLSRDPIELAGNKIDVFNKRIYFTFGI